MTTATVIRDEIRYTVTLVTMVCCTCQCPFAMPEDLQKRARNDKDSWFYCPNGHRQHYGRDELDRARDKLAKAERERDNARAAFDREHDLRAFAERSAAAFKGQATRLRKRVGNGVCPCCNRTFKQLAAHMDRMHPGYADAGVADPEGQ